MREAGDRARRIRRPDAPLVANPRIGRALSRGRLRVSINAGPYRAASRGLAAWLAGNAPSWARGEVSVALVSDGVIRRLNARFRGKASGTDVLSFPATEAQSSKPRAADRRPGDGDFLGDVVIAVPAVGRQAREAGHAAATELRILALHGLLHLLGYDHERDEGRMARLERRLRRRAGLPEGLIERTRVRS
ncbi:MAG: rRNA maturation RNase YbeY [Acidobacteria bacterium]|nr:rRNA maturation RNase YbeY [Acidobacteriota bacterium]